MRQRAKIRNATPAAISEDRGNPTMVRAKGIYRNQSLELEQPLELPDGTPVEVDVYSADESHDSEAEGWAQLGMERLEEEWDNPEDAIYDDWKRFYGV
jgi:hypothetical protein